MKSSSRVFAVFVATIGLNSAVLLSALQCYQWTEDDDPTQAKVTTCGPDNHNCAFIGLDGFNRITRQKITLSLGMCGSNACNATRLCHEAYKSIKNFDATKCTVSCCDSDKCNAVHVSTTTPTEAMQTIAIPRNTKRIHRSVRVPMPTTDDEEFDYFTMARLSCYHCEEGTELEICQLIPSATRCGKEHDSCVSITGTLSDSDNNIEVAYRGCGLAEINCNITQLCIDVRNKLFVNQGKEMTSCNGYCCRNNFCNNFNPTRPVKLSTSLKTTKSRRTSTHLTESTPIKCYECKPEAFGSMCRKNTTMRMCETGYHGYDSCLTMTAAITNATTNEVIDDGEWMDCAVRDMDCNVNSSRCDTLSDILKSRGLGIKNCHVNCCHGDLCNNFAPTAGPNITAQAVSKAQGRLLGNTSILNGIFIINLFMLKTMS